jgi:transposase-like protein
MQPTNPKRHGVFCASFALGSACRVLMLDTILLNRRRHSSPRAEQCAVLADRASFLLLQSGEQGRQCQCRPSPYMNNIIEQDHRFVKKRVVASQWFRSVDGGLNTIAGYEAMNIIRKGRIRWLAKGGIVGQARFIERTLGLAA